MHRVRTPISKDRTNNPYREKHQLAEVHDGSIALVTGAAQGIGRATALRLAADGALVAANDREPSRALEEVDQAYGPRVGVHRILDLLRSHGTEATCPVPSCYSPPTWRTGSLSGRASASLRTVWTIGAVSPSPKRM